MRAWRFAAIAVLLPVGLTAQEPRASLEADLTEVTVGDRLTATITVDHRADQSPQWPETLNVAPFEALGFAPTPPRIDGDLAVSVATLSLAAFELGELEIPPIRITLADANGVETVVSTDPYVVGVVSVGLDEGNDIRDVKGPLGIARDWVLMWPWLLAILAAAGVAYWLARRRRAPGDRTAPAVPPRPPYETAMDALASLEASSLLERGMVKDFHIALSQIVRTYVEGRFRIDALEMTTRELVSALHLAGTDADLLEDTRGFLEACDLVKFAKRRPETAESLRLIPVARRFVEETRPVDVTESDGDDSAERVDDALPTPEAA
ncbi:MAG: hypothetical protein OEU54_17260 [Gemmatimonadota bacterium]|nr:hypothetical protein [Gemmatimonadota bacterium]